MVYRCMCRGGFRFEGNLGRRRIRRIKGREEKGGREVGLGKMGAFFECECEANGRV